MRYQVKYGDSPTRIAREYGVSFDALINANPHKPTTIVDGRRTWQMILPRETIIVPVGGMVADAASDQLAIDLAIGALIKAGGPCLQANVGLTCAAQRALGFTPGAGLDGKWGSTASAAAKAKGGFNVPACTPRPSWWTPPGQSNCAPSAPAPKTSSAPAGGSNLALAAGAALAALSADSGYCSSVARSGTAVNTAVHNFKAAWNAANPRSPVPIGTGKYEPSVAAALSSALGGVAVPPGCGAAAAPAPAPAAQPAPSGLPSPAQPSALGVAALAALSALSADSNYCASVARAGTPVNNAVHNFKAAWNAANPRSPVPIGTGKYEPSVAAALSSALGGKAVPPGCGATTTPTGTPTGSVPGGTTPSGSMPVTVSVPSAVQALTSFDPCLQENVALVCQAQAAIGLRPGAGLDGKWGTDSSNAAKKFGINVPACDPRPAWWTPKGQSNCPGTGGSAIDPAAAAKAAAAAAAAKAAADAAAKAAADATNQSQADAAAAAAKAAMDAAAKAAADAAASGNAAAAQAASDAATAAAKAASDAAAKNGSSGGGAITPPEEKKGLSTGAIVVGALGAAALVGLVAYAASSGGKKTAHRGGTARKSSRKSKPAHRKPAHHKPAHRKPARRKATKKKRR